jgi:carbon storage regulator
MLQGGASTRLSPPNGGVTPKREACTERKPREKAKGMVMLVLSRKKNESIVINNDITIVVVEIRGDKVRLGVEAPKEVPVHRQEVYEAIRRSEGTLKPTPESNGASSENG